MTKRSRLVAFAVVAIVVAAVLIWKPSPPPPAGPAGPESRAGSSVGSGMALPPVGPPPAAVPSPADAHGAGSPIDGTAPAASPSAAAAVAAASAAPDALARASGTPTTQEAMIDLDKTRRMILDYHTRMGENPVGTNAEIMKAVMGGNPAQAVLGPADGQQLNARGELLDRWGTPYFFHQLSGNHMEIHSAGPDRIMGTDDDLVLK